MIARKRFQVRSGFGCCGRMGLVIWLVAGCLAVGAEDARLVAARQALEDGLPAVAVHKLRSSDQKWNDADAEVADLLLGRALVVSQAYEDAVLRLKPLAAGSPEAGFWLAEALAGLGKSDDALVFYQKVPADDSLAGSAAIGASRMLVRLGRAEEAAAELQEYLGRHPDDQAVAMELAALAIDRGDVAMATATLKQVEGTSAEANLLRARTLLLEGKFEQAGAVLNVIEKHPADLAAAVVLTRAVCWEQQNQSAEAENVLEAWLEENPSLPGMPEVFAALDRIYATETGASDGELRRWVADAGEPVRGGFAMYYLARFEKRVGDAEMSRNSYQEFLQRYPESSLVDAAREELAESLLNSGRANETLDLLGEESRPREIFLRARAQADLGNYPQAEADFLAAAQDPRLESDALFNAAVSAMLAGVPDEKNVAVLRLRSQSDREAMLEKFDFLSALHAASRRDAGAEETLRVIADGNSPYSASARLALAEWAALQLDYARAGRELIQISSDDVAVTERAAALGVFVADTGETDDQVKMLAETFLQNHPESDFVPEVRMKLGEILFRRGDYLAARAQFVAIAEDFPDSPLAEKAVFLTARSMERSMDPKIMGEAIVIYESVVNAGGPLAQRARLAQAILFSALKKPRDAIGVLDRILESDTDPELRATALIEKGDIHFSQGEADPKNYEAAIAVWTPLAEDDSIPRMWSNQARFKIGTAQEKRQEIEAALDTYYTVVARGPVADENSEPEYFWYYKAGFEAGALLEERRQWTEAIAVYEKLGAVDGPRASEAADRVKKLRLANFIWDD